LLLAQRAKKLAYFLLIILNENQREVPLCSTRNV